jgi:hypothetical protein
MESPYSCSIALLPPPPLSHQVPESSNLHPTSTTDAKGELLLRRGIEWAEEGLGRCTSRGETRLASSSRRAEDVGGIKNGCQGVASCQVRSLGFRESYGTAAPLQSGRQTQRQGFKSSLDTPTPCDIPLRHFLAPNTFVRAFVLTCASSTSCSSSGTSTHQDCQASFASDDREVLPSTHA